MPHPLCHSDILLPQFFGRRDHQCLRSGISAEMFVRNQLRDKGFAGALWQGEDETAASQMVQSLPGGVSLIGPESQTCDARKIPHIADELRWWRQPPLLNTGHWSTTTSNSTP